MKSDIADRNVTVEGTLAAETHDLIFDEDATLHLMSIMTDMYSDSVLAVIREYISNAWDSLRAIGSTEPILVSAPNNMRPSFIVQDFGTGMSRDDLINIYRKYGKSTKRESNDYVGMLGIGCKAALSYTSQFTVTAVKDGKMTICVVGRDSDGRGTVDLFDSTDTDKPNGVTVTVPVNPVDIGSFNDSLARFLAFWPADTVTVDGVAHKPHVIKRASERVGFYKADWDSNVVVMGNVAYRLNTGNIDFVLPALPNGFNWVFFADIGDVSFTPSREDLFYNDKTKAFLKREADAARDGLEKSALEHVAEAETSLLAIQRTKAWQSALGGKIDYKWNNMSVPLRHEFDRPKYDQFGKQTNTDLEKAWQYYVSYGSSKPSTVWNFDTEEIGNMLFVVNFAKASVSPHFRRKTRIYLDQVFKPNNPKDNYAKTVIFFEGPEFLKGWIPAHRVVDFSTIDAIKVPRSNSGSSGGVGSGKYNAYLDGKPTVLDKLPALYYYASPADDKNMQAISKHTDVPVVEVPRNRWDKMLREYPGGKTLQNLKESKIGELKAKVTLEIMIGDKISNDWDFSRTVDRLDGIKTSEVLDPDLKAFGDGYFKKCKKAYNEFTQSNAFFVNYTTRDKILTGFSGEVAEVVRKVKEASGRYPLISQVNYGLHSPDVVEYINAVYTYRSNK